MEKEIKVTENENLEEECSCEKNCFDKAKDFVKKHKVKLVIGASVAGAAIAGSIVASKNVLKQGAESFKESAKEVGEKVVEEVGEVKKNVKSKTTK